MTRHFTTAQINAMSDQEVNIRLLQAVGAIAIKDDSGNTHPWWWIPGTPTWKSLLLHWQSLQGWPPWQPVLCAVASTLDTAYAQTGQTRNTSLTLPEAARWLLDWIDENEWAPSPES